MASKSSFGEKAIPDAFVTAMVSRENPEAILYTLTALRQQIVALSLPVQEKTTDLTTSAKLSSVYKTSPRLKSQSFKVWSPDADTNSLPSGENATDKIISV
jgi:hypothetical protein